jgi:hypothetical protein
VSHVVLPHLPSLPSWLLQLGRHLGTIAAVTVAVLAVVLVAMVALRRWRSQRMVREARFVTVYTPAVVDPNGGMQLWSNLVALLRPHWHRLVLGQPHIAFEVTWSGDQLRVGIWVPGAVPPGLVERAVEAAWPGARTEVSDPPEPLPAAWASLGGELKLALEEWLPLRLDHPTDPFRALAGAAGGLTGEQAAAVQVLARPVTGRRVRHSLEAAAALRHGAPPWGVARLLEGLMPSGGRGRGSAAAPRPRLDPAAQNDVRLILAKGAGPQWEVLVRYGVATGAAADKGEARAWLRGRAHALAAAFAVHTGRNRLRRRRRRGIAATLARRDFAGGSLVSVPELAALAHPPSAETQDQADTSRVAAPAQLVPDTGFILGDADHGPARCVALKPTDLHRHMHILGNTGTGKSTLIQNVMLSAIEHGWGAILVEPHGDISLDLLDRLPAEASGRVVILDPRDIGACPGINPLDGPDPDLAVDNVVTIFRRTFERFWGPRTDDILRVSCLTLLRRGQAALTQIPRLLSDDVFRARCTKGLDDLDGLGGFWTWYEALSEAARAQAVGPLVSKLRAFLLRPFVRAVVGGEHTTLNISEVLDGGVLIVRLPKGKLGAETCDLLGSFINEAVWQAVTAREMIPEPERHNALVVLDEFQNFVVHSDGFAERLSEARKYHVGYVLAHQYLDQLPRDVRQAISGQARSKTFFTMSVEDAAALARHVEPQLRAGDLARLANYQAAVRLCVDGGLAPACTIRTRPAPPADPARAQLVRTASRARFAKPEAQEPPTPPQPVSFAAGGGESAAVAAQDLVKPRASGGPRQRRRIRVTPLDLDATPTEPPLAMAAVVPLFPAEKS